MPSTVDEERSITARLPAALAQRLEDLRYHISRATGRRVSTKALVKEALERFIEQAEKKLRGE